MYFIYFIKIDDTVKIGICQATLKHLKQRLSEAQRWCANAKLIGCLFSENSDTEKRIHLYFDELTIRSELFKWDKKILRFIKMFCDWTPSKRAISFSHETLLSCISKYDDKQDAIKYFKGKYNIQPSKSITLEQWIIPYEICKLKTDTVQALTKQGIVTKRKNYDYDYDANYYEYHCKKDDNVTEIMPTCDLWDKWGDCNNSLFDKVKREWFSVSYEKIGIYEGIEPIDYLKKINLLLDKIKCLSAYYLLENRNRIEDSSILPKIPTHYEEQDEYDDDDWQSGDFTGIGDDGFYYVDGEFCIEDPLGIEHY